MDYLKDCMNDVGNPPIDAMHRNFCLVCANRGCERSGLSQSAFDNRVKNWKDTLFLKVPRAAPDDPAYSNIRSKAFTPIGVSAPEPPKTTIFMPGVPVASAPVQMARPSAFVTREAEPAPAPAEEPALDLEPVGRHEPAAEAVPAQRVAPPGNTPFQQGMVLGGGPPPPPPPVPEPPPGQGGQGQTFILEDED